MIIDRIENASLYYALGNEIAEAFEHLKNNDLSGFSPGSYSIVKDKIRMLVFDSFQTNTDRITMEGHRRNIDLQYWVSGSELMGYAPLESQPLLKPFNEEKDYGNYEADASYTRFEPGMFAIYFPTDLHTAVIDEQCNSPVRKIVYKVGIV
ncbi:MAG: YhcH/YjgK/YiaL family protein [Mariniphaga sp.]